MLTADLMTQILWPCLLGCTGFDEVTGKVTEISEYIDFDFWDLVWYWPRPKPSVDMKERHQGWWAGVSHCVGSNLFYWIIPVSDIPIADTTVQQITWNEFNDLNLKAHIGNSNLQLEKCPDAENYTLLRTVDFLAADEYHWPNDVAYGNNNTTLPDDDFSEPAPCLDKDEVEVLMTLSSAQR